MKFDIQQEVLANALDRVSMILGSGETEKAESYLFLYEKETLFVMASSGGMLAKTPVGADSVEAEDEESFIIHGKNTKVWVENQLGDTISVNAESGKATLVCGKSKRSAKINPGRDYPRMDQGWPLSEELFKIPTKTFAEAVAFSKVFVCPDASTPHLAMSSSKEGALLSVDEKLAGFVFFDGFADGLDLHLNTEPKVLSFLGQCTGDEIEVHKSEAKYFLRDTDSGSLLVFQTVAADFPSFGLGSRDTRQEPERWTVSKDILRKAVTALSAGASDDDDRLEFTVSGMSGDATMMLSMSSTVSEERNEQDVPDVIRQCHTRKEVYDAEGERVSTELSDDLVDEHPSMTLALRKSHLLRALSAFKDPDVTAYIPNETLYQRVDEEGHPFEGEVRHRTYLCFSEEREGYTVVSLLNLVP
jgi:hypothetical protein